MDKRIRHLLLAFCLVFLIVTANLTYLQLFAASKLTSSQYNKRDLNEELSTARGSILTADGVEIAKSERSKGSIYSRFYPQGEAFSAVSGFYDSRYGRFALEQRYNDQLLGRDQEDTLADYIKRIEGQNQPGNDLMLTINSKVQRMAYKKLIGYRGAIVALDPSTGQVLALASYPGYNPNTLRQEWSKLAKDKNSPLLNRATRGLYPPGSSFKTVTLAGAIGKGVTKPEQIYDAPATLPVYGSKVTNYKSKKHGRITLQEAFSDSVNTVFAQVGLKLGAAGLVDTAGRFGFNKDLGFDLTTENSRIASVAQMDKVDIAWTAVGQGETLVTPLQMAMVSAAIANNGKLMRPYLVKKIRDYKGKTVEKFEPAEFSTVLESAKARIVKSMMMQVVQSGTGKAARIDGILVGGKTGTAEVKGNKPHSWFIAFAPANKPKVAIAVLIENAGTGGAIAAPIAKEVMEEALSKH